MGKFFSGNTEDTNRARLLLGNLDTPTRNEVQTNLVFLKEFYESPEGKAHLRNIFDVKSFYEHTGKKYTVEEFENIFLHRIERLLSDFKPSLDSKS